MIDDLLASLIAEHQIPGISVAVARGDERLLSASAGLARLDPPLPATLSTTFGIGSVTKTFTAAAILLLSERGALGLEQQAREVLPELPARWDAVAIRHLLCHQSGIRNHTNPANNPSFATERFSAVRPEQHLARVADLELCCPPGQECWYSNTGYLVLGMIIERVSGCSYEAFLRQEIFARLGLAKTRLSDDEASGYEDALSYTHDGVGLAAARAEDPSASFGAGSLVSTAEDLVRWASSLRPGTLLSAESLGAMWSEARTDTGAPTGYGLGWAIRSTPAGRQVFHLGRADEFMAGVCRWLEPDLTVAWACNRFAPQVGDLHERVAQALGLLDSPGVAHGKR
jgi:CubicO group peptidase (beta-lactamase class C family)